MYLLAAMRCQECHPATTWCTQVFPGIKATWTHGLLVLVLAWLVFARILPKVSQGGNQLN